MGATGSLTTSGGGAPLPEPERVAMIRYTIVDEPETCAAFAEPARAVLASLNERALAETRSGDLGECSLLLDHVRDRVGGLDPARLQPRTGLAGLFDSRGKRLKGFRAAYASAASAVAQSAADIGDRAGALARKHTALETLWGETRDAIAELDAHIAAARAWLATESIPPVTAGPVAEASPQVEEESPAPVAAGDAPSDPVEAEAASETMSTTGEEPLAPVEADTEPPAPAETTADAGVEADAHEERHADPLPEAAEAAAEAVELPEPATAPEYAPVASLPHPLVTRLGVLEAVRATAIGRLPLLRAAQNADCRAPAALKRVCDGVEAWRADWQDALGLAGKRPKTVRPDRDRLTTATTTLSDHIQAAGRELSAAQTRRAELDARTVAPPPPASLAA